MRTRLLTLIMLIALGVGTTFSQQNNHLNGGSPWAFSWGVGLGTMIPSGDLGTLFKPGFAADTEVSVYYKNFFAMVNGGFASTALSGDIGFDNAVWQAPSKAIQASFSGNIGYNIYNQNNVSIYPYVGIGYGMIEPAMGASDNELIKSLRIDGMIWNAGIGMAYNFPDKNYDPARFNRILKLGVRYQYQHPNYTKEFTGFEGATHWLTLRAVIGSTW